MDNISWFYHNFAMIWHGFLYFHYYYVVTPDTIYSDLEAQMTLFFNLLQTIPDIFLTDRYFWKIQNVKNLVEEFWLKLLLLRIEVVILIEVDFSIFYGRMVDN